jgi:membrane protease YdiL (CAAX protease family)
VKANDPFERGLAHASVLWVAIETVLATVLALYVSQRLDAPLVWLFFPLALLWLRRLPMSEYGLDLRFRPPSAATHALLGVTLLALYAVLHAAVATAVLHRTFAPALPANPLVGLASEFLAVGFPEEVFFRGYLQTRWDRACGRPWRLFGAAVGPALPLQAAIFAACHVVTGDWTRSRVFFFGLLAGWLRARSGSVLSPAIYHAVANVWYRCLVASFR